ncbi:MAG TPA: CHRD domain-containing protein [Thermoanaerobaculia bacterium]|nr:CHRD domain-containing protein [Thermoanaerobaculia bacterium]
MRNNRLLLAFALLTLIAASPALAQAGRMTAQLRGFEEVPATAVANSGTFTATVNGANTEINFNLTYKVPEGTVTQAHLHFAQKGVNGGIVIFLCSNLPNPPAGTQACPEHEGSVSGTINAEDVLAVNSQSAVAGDLPSVLRAIRSGIVYANVHTDQLPGGSIRGQVDFSRGRNN